MVWMNEPEGTPDDRYYLLHHAQFYVDVTVGPDGLERTIKWAPLRWEQSYLQYGPPSVVYIQGSCHS